MTNKFLTSLFHIDALTILMVALVMFIGLCVGSFASRYLKGDRHYQRFFVQLICLVCSVTIMVSADQLILLFFALAISNILLVQLMIHKSSWKAAKAAGFFAARNYLFSLTCIMGSFVIFYLVTGNSTIQGILHQHKNSNVMLIGLIMLLVGAMAQSAIWPFHRWLLSSLNSPTPVSAIMHAGLINGGGFLLARFAPLYFEYPKLLSTIFLIGIFTALLGTLWKLMQSDVKRMLACSTMAQMGFMLAQSGLGLFSATISHLILHGLFKAYLFLVSGSAAQDKLLNTEYSANTLNLICAIICGFVASLAFGISSNNSWFKADTTVVLMVVAFIAATQFALTLLRTQSFKAFAIALIFTVAISWIYGAILHVMNLLLQNMHLTQAQSLNVYHIVGMLALILAWLYMKLLSLEKRKEPVHEYLLKSYVMALNASQPHPTTITAYRNHYKYL